MSTATEVVKENGNGQIAAAQPAAAPKAPILASTRGLVLHSLDEMFRFAKAVAASGLAPKGIQTPEAIFVALQMGMELGLTPMASLQNIAVINGRPSVWGDAQMAVCRGSGVFDEEAFEETIAGTGDAMTATCTVRRLPKGKPVTRTFSVADAKTAQLWGKTGPWTQFPKRMLQMRARGFALRDAFSDTLRGFPAAEDMRDAIDVEALPVKAVQTLEDLRTSWTDTPTVAVASTPEVHADPATEAVDPPALTDGEMTTDEFNRAERMRVELEACESLTDVNKVKAHWLGLTEPSRHQWVNDASEAREAEIRASRGQRGGAK